MQPHLDPRVGTAAAVSSTTQTANIFPSELSRRYYELLLSKIGETTIAVPIHPSAISGCTHDQHWKDLRTAVEYLVYEQKKVAAFALAIDGQTLLLLVHAQDHYDSALPPFFPANTPWFCPSNPSPRVSSFPALPTAAQSQVVVVPVAAPAMPPTLAPAVEKYMSRITLLCQQRDALRVKYPLVLIVDAMPTESPSPIEDMKKALSHMLKEGQILTYACDQTASKFHVMVKQGEYCDPEKDKTRTTNWISLKQPQETLRTDIPAAVKSAAPSKPEAPVTAPPVTKVATPAATVSTPSLSTQSTGFSTLVRSKEEVARFNEDKYTIRFFQGTPLLPGPD